MFIKEIIPKIILDSRKEKTIEIMVITYEGKFTASAPSGKSKGSHEVPYYNKKGIERSLKLLNIFCKILKGKNFRLKRIDDLKILVELIKRFEVKYGRFGGNVIYALETAFLKAGAKDNNRQFWELINDDINSGVKPIIPMPVGNCIGGGLHTKKINGKRADFQEFLLIPDRKKVKTFSRGVTINLIAQRSAGKLLKSNKRNDEGAWATDKSNEEILDIMFKISKKYNLRIGLDIAASAFYKGGYYNYKNKNLIRDKIDQVDYIERMISKYGVYYTEDPLNEEDFSGFRQLLEATKSMKRLNPLIVGDDLTTTNMKLLRRAVASNSINALIIKPNQIGSIIEVKNVVEFCKQNKITMVFSHRSGETMDDALADYCVGFGGHFIKTGIFGKERLIKLKRVMDIEKSL
tara:strand:+ start:28388 stop:29605 length:1218 start_codon:yes stop_codon:yes gene_type:complete